MSKKKHRGRGARGGTASTPFVGRGGGGPGGQGRGASTAQRTPGSSFLQEELDFTIQMYADSPNPPPHTSSRGNSTPRGGRGHGRGRGRGRGFWPPTSQPNGQNYRRWDPPPLASPEMGGSRGRGRGETVGPRPRRGRGLGAVVDTHQIGQDATLSELLFASRPLLRPVCFVPSAQMPVLFQQEEDILQPVVEEIGDDEASHVPTADRVTRIFSGVANPFGDPSEEEVEEIDFNDIAKLLESSGTTARRHIVRTQPPRHIDENQRAPVHGQQNMPESSIDVISTGLNDTTKEIGSTVEFQSSRDLREGTESEMVAENIVRPIRQPTDVADASSSLATAPLTTPRPETLLEDEEIIVYEAPHPKVRERSTLAPAITGDLQTGPEEADTSKFEPYEALPMLSLAAMSITEFTVPDEPPQPPSAPDAALPLPALTASSIKFDFSRRESRASTSGSKLLGMLPPRKARAQKAWERKKVKRGLAHGKKRRPSGHFAAFGALLSEAQLRGSDSEDVLGGTDLKQEERRRGDSDLDWGTESDGSGGEEKTKVTGHDLPMKSENAKGKQKERPEEEAEGNGMEVDSELEMDVAAMKRFVGGLMGRDAGTFTTIDDMVDQEKMRAEDEEPGGAEGSSEDSSSEDEDDQDNSEGEDEDIEGVLKLHERLLIGEDEGDELDEKQSDGTEDDSEEGSEEENDFSPKSSFQARLERLRAQARGKRPSDAALEDEDEGDMLKRNMAWAEDDELAMGIQELLDENADTLEHNRKERNKVFRAVQNGDFADMQPARKRKDKYKGIPEDLRALWEKDREKKAERKQARALEKLIRAADPFSKKKGGKKRRKSMVAAARLDPTINVIPNRIIDFTTLVQQIRRFVMDLSDQTFMRLPPANKETRRNVHELAQAFGLKSQSKGGGDARYTILYKTTRTGQGVNEKKVAKIMRSAGARGGGYGGSFGEFVEGRERKRGPALPRQREGEEVGAAAPKIDESNIGFKMLASMGWTEGDQIGLSGGLDVPLVAVIKHSKLGLGATK